LAFSHAAIELVGLLAGGVALEHCAHERRAFGIGHGDLALRVADVAPGETAEEVALAGLLA
jgi:hypothetical protein